MDIGYSPHDYFVSFSVCECICRLLNCSHCTEGDRFSYSDDTFTHETTHTHTQNFCGLRLSHPLHEQRSIFFLLNRGEICHIGCHTAFYRQRSHHTFHHDCVKRLHSLCSQCNCILSASLQLTFTLECIDRRN